MCELCLPDLVYRLGTYGVINLRIRAKNLRVKTTVLRRDEAEVGFVNSVGVVVCLNMEPHNLSPEV